MQMRTGKGMRACLHAINKNRQTVINATADTGDNSATHPACMQELDAGVTADTGRQASMRGHACILCSPQEQCK